MGLPQAWREMLARVRGDLVLFALLQLPMLLASAVLGRTLAGVHAYPYSRATENALQIVKSMRLDLLAIAALAALVLLCGALRVRERWRTPALVTIYCGFWLLGALYLLGAGVFMRFGGPLDRDLVRMCLPMLDHAAKVVSWHDPVVRLAAVSTVLPFLFTLAAWASARRLAGERAHRSPVAWSLVGAMLLLAGLPALLPANPGREKRLQRISPLALLLPSAWSAPQRPPAPEPGHRAALDRLLGPPRSDAVAAFAALPRRPRNVVVWVLESTGERFLRSHHPLGQARTPQLDRIEARGAVRFTQAFVECPLSAQSMYTLVSGSSPPANPGIFRSDLPLAPRTPYLPAVLKAAGYQTAFLSSADLSLWGEQRFLREAGFDVLEDKRNLPNRSRYRYQPWSIEGRAIVDRFFDWRDAQRGHEPFFAIVWNVETHFRYEWIGMPAEYADADELTHYTRAIEYTDGLLGRFFDGLDARGLADDTLIIAVGDHGQGLGRGGRAYDRFESLLVGEDDLQVPLSFIHPALPKGPAKVDVVTTLADLYPTILDLAGVALPPSTDGASLAREHPPKVLVSRAITWFPLALRAGRFKLLQEFPTDPPALYDLAADPWESHDVAGGNPKVYATLWAELGAVSARVARDDPSFALFSAAGPQPATTVAGTR